MKPRILIGDCLARMRAMPDNSVDSIVTDPPYGISFMGKRWDCEVPSVEVWAECLRVLKPGGHLLAFAGTRTQHRMAVNIEDAGFEIRDMIAWVYGSGFPKSLDVSKAIDKAAGATREVVGSKVGLPGYSLNQCDEPGGVAMSGNVDGSLRNPEAECAITAPATDAARQWSGWGTALKPAMEPITVARKPLAGTVAANVLAHGTGGLNIDGCRVPMNGEVVTTGQGTSGSIYGGGNGLRPAEMGTKNFTSHDAGRWPANLIHDGSDDVLEAFPDAKGQQGDLKGHSRNRDSHGIYGDMGPAHDAPKRIETDNSAARFFYCAKATRKDRNEGLTDPGPQFKHGNTLQKVERTATAGNNHPTVKPTDLMRYLCRLVTPAGGVVMDPFMGSGSTGKAAALEGFRFIGIEMDPDYAAIAIARITAVAAAPSPQSDLLDEVTA